MRKFLIFIGVVLLGAVACCLPVRAAEASLTRPIWPNALEKMQEQDNEQTLLDMIAEVTEASFVLSQKTAGRSSFRSRCGTLTAHQLYNLGIDDTLFVKNGNEHFDHYLALEVSSGGYYINAYPSEEYTLENALNAVSDYGNKVVFNVVVCFQWTNTTLGGLYGHSMVINAIIDGEVYFTESYDTPFGPEGSLMICSIEEFADFFEPWTLFEGLVHFGDGEYSEVCPTISTDLTVQARFDSRLRSQPADIGSKGSALLREVEAGEVFHAVAVCRDNRGDFYKVLTPEGEAYISAVAVSVVGTGSGEMVLNDLKMPGKIKAGYSFELAGSVEATYGRVAMLGFDLYLPDGTPVRKAVQEVDDRSGELNVLNPDLCLEYLEPGTYQAEVYAYCVSPVSGTVWGQSRYRRVMLQRRELVVEP